jgi:hypothetical protein
MKLARLFYNHRKGSNQEFSGKTQRTLREDTESKERPE